MKVKNIKEVEGEVIRLLKRIKELKKHQTMDRDVTYPSKETAASKRALMDLSSSLSKMRNDLYEIKIIYENIYSKSRF